MTRLVHVVGAQISPIGGDPEVTFEKFADEVRTIRRSFPQADLYLFPELFLAGEMPFRTHVAIGGNRHRVPGPFTDRIGEVARRAGRWIQAGSIYEAAGRKTYNTALLFAPDGSLAATECSRLASRSCALFLTSPCLRAILPILAVHGPRTNVNRRPNPCP